MATNVSANQLNYDHYATSKYDRDIVNSIPGHKELHQKIAQALQSRKWPKNTRVLELGTGTGITAAIVLTQLPGAEYVGIDFSRQMLSGARKRLAKWNAKLILADYSKTRLPTNNDIVASVIGLHHQKTDADKKRVFKKIFAALAPKGIFIFGDLMTCEDKEEAALNEVLHDHYLVEHSTDEKTLKEWAFHHQYLNCLAPIEKQVKWLKQVGFKRVKVAYRKFNTVLIVAEK